jgi:hypothetical protein
MAVTAVLQAFLLISSLVLTPALVIAQEEQAGAEPAQAAAPLALFIQPDPVKLQVGQTEPVTAWACDPATTLGPDADPAGLGCQKVEAEWSLSDNATGTAEFSKDEAAKTRVTALAVVDGAKVIAKAEGFEPVRADLTIKPDPAAEQAAEAAAAEAAEEAAAAEAAAQAEKEARQAEKAEAEKAAAAQAAEAEKEAPQAE